MFVSAPGKSYSAIQAQQERFDAPPSRPVPGVHVFLLFLLTEIPTVSRRRRHPRLPNLTKMNTASGSAGTMQVIDPAPPAPVPGTISGAPWGAAAANAIYSESNAVGEGAGDSGVAEEAASAGLVEVPEQEESSEPVPKRLRPHDPTVQIREVTNDGDAANLEMLIHLKASRCWIFLRLRCPRDRDRLRISFP